MTLDEAIKNAEEVAIEEDKLCKRSDDASGYSRSHNEEIRTSYAKNCEKRADEHRQLAEWLKDYKRLKEQELIYNSVESKLKNPKAKTFDILRFVADNAGLSIFEAIEKAYHMGVSEQECILNKIRAEIKTMSGDIETIADVLTIIDKYKVETEET